MIRWQISHTLATRAENVSGDWHDLRECVNLASTRWINAIIGQTWGEENPFKARKAKQGPWLIHLANLRVMYECQGTLVRRGRGECVLAAWIWVCLFFVSYMWRCSLVAQHSPWELVSNFSPLRPPLPSQRTKQMNPGRGNDKKMHWVQWVRGKRDCFANEVGEQGCGPLGGRVTTTMPCRTTNSITSCRLNDCSLYAAVEATLWQAIVIKRPQRADL